MKHKKLIRKRYRFACRPGYSWAAFLLPHTRAAAMRATSTPTPVTEETPAPETEPEETTGGYEPQPLTAGRAT